MTQNTPLRPDVAEAFADLPEEFQGFARLFQDELRPILLAGEAKRIAGVKKQRMGLFAGLGIGGTGAGVGLVGLEEPIVAALSGMAGFGLWGWAGGDLRAVGRKAKTQLITPVAEKFDLSFDGTPPVQDSLYDFRRNSLLPNWDRASCEDKFTGRRGDTDFGFYEAHLEQRRQTRDSKGRTQTRWVTVFRGQTLNFKTSQPITGKVILRRDQGWFNALGGMFGGELERVKLESPEFEKAFEVYATDQIEARYLLTPQFMQTLVDLESTLNGANLRCAFLGNDVLVATDGGNLFEPGSMLTPLDNPTRVKELLLDFNAVFNVIDTIRSR